MAIKNRLFIILFILLGFLYTAPVRAGIEPQTLDFLNRYQRPLRWDNVEGSPVWLSGAEPQYSFNHKYHIIILQPGDDVTIRLPAHAMARIIDPAEVLKQTTLEASISRGNGLFQRLPLSVDGDNSLYVHPDLQENSLFRLKNSSSALDSVELALFISRYEPLLEPLAYRQLLELSAPTVDVQTKLFGAGLDFQQLSANRPSQIRIQGPLRLLFEHRLIFPTEGLLQRTPYTIKGLLDTHHVFTLSGTTPPESRVLLQMDDLYPTLGLLRKSYITVPEGEHILTLIPDSNLLLRLTARDESDYLFPDLNDPFPLDDEQSKKNTDPFTLFSWPKEPSSILQPELTEPLDRAHRLWQNNRYPDGGLSAAMALQQLAERHPESTELQNESKRIKHEYTFYRDLFPKTQGQALHQKYTAHISPKLKADAKVQQRVLQHNNLPAVIDTMERAYFTDLPVVHEDNQSSDAPSLTFLLPIRQTPSSLRILVDVTQKNSGSFTVSIGNNPPIQLDVLPHLIRPADEFELDKTEAAINLADETHSHFHPLTPILDSMGRPTAQQHVAELIVPLDTIAEKVILCPAKTNETSLRVALQYRDTRPFTLAEKEYLQAKEKLGQEITPYNVALMMLADPQIEFDKTGEIYGEGILEIEAFLRPLIRYIHTRDIVFSSSIHPTPNKAITAALSLTDADSIRKRISLAQEAEQWVAVLENAVLLYHGTHGQSKINAAMLIVDALEYSGEPYLAEMRLRGMLSYPQGNEGEHLAKLARIRLEKLYRNRNDIRSLSILYATCLRKDPSPQLLEKLAGILLQEGRYRLALSATVILPTSEQNSDYLLRSTLKAGWNQTFESAVERIDTSDKQNYWRGLLQEKPGAQGGDDSFFMAAGSRGESHSQAMEQARTIETQLNNNDLKKRQQAIFSWEKWQEKFHGPYSWKNEPWLIFDHAGGVFLYSEAQDLKLLMFKATQKRPVQARIWGPVTMKLILRPLHTNISDEALSGWGFLRIDDELELIPINNNRPVQQWAMPPAEKNVPGRIVEFERRLGPGPHDIRISSETLSLLVAFQVLRPESNNGLPALSHDAVARILQSVEQKENLLQISRLVCLTDDSHAFLYPNPEDEPLFFSSRQLKLNRDKNKQSISQVRETIARLELSRPPASATMNKNDPGKMTRLMATEKWDDALAAAGDSTIAERFRLMSLLTYLTERRPTEQERYESRARNIFQDHPLEKELHTLLQRISAKSQWKQVEQIQGSAGLRLIPLQNWLPESPTLRIRKALLTTELNRGAVLTSKDPLVLFLNNLETIELEVSWKLSEVAYLHPEKLDITYHLDDEQEKTISFSNEQPEQSVRITIPTGRHRLVTTIQNRYSNQFLQIRFQKIPPSAANDNRDITWDLPLKERAYHVVTKDVPLRASIKGPTWVRFDEYLQEETFSHYQYIESGWQTIEIRPDKNQREMLVRLFQRTLNHDKEKEELSRKTIRTYPVLQPPLLTFSNEQKSKAGVNFLDNYQMGRQEDGTWSTTLSWHKRLDLEEDAINGESETFFQFTENYYHYYDSIPAYLKSSFFVRKRTLGGPTFGLTGDVRKSFHQIPITFRLMAEGLTQNPDAGETDFFDRDPMEWSLRAKASIYQYRPITPKLKHRPGLLFFGRLLSLDNDSSYAPGTIDQDIFTQYKSDHPSGMLLSEYLIYRPWLDTALFARGSYTTNADMNPLKPDSVRFSGGIGQMIGPATLDLRYQRTHFFDDEDRTLNIDRNDLSFALNWDHWFKNQSRIQLGMKMLYRLESKDITGTAGLTWFFSTSRAMRDLRPEDDLFYTIISNRASQLINNRTTDAEVSP